MKIAEFKMIREHNKNLMGKFFQDYQKERNEMEIPDLSTLSKRDYIKAWFETWGIYIHGESDELNYMLRYTNEKLLHLKKGFEWTHRHFAELELGCNMRSFGATSSIIEHLKNNTWTKPNERKLIIEYMQQTEWYQD